MLLEESIERIHAAIGLRNEIKIKHLRIHHALLSLELLHAVDKVELGLILSFLAGPMPSFLRGGEGIGVVREGERVGIHWVVVEDLRIGDVVVY